MPLASVRSRRGGLVFAGLLLFGLTLFLRSTPNAFPFGDAAIIEIYTLQAVRGFLKLGPYSQFLWHHPGPIYFYSLVPFYELSGGRAIGLAASALTINFASVVTTGWIAARNRGRPVAAVLVASLVIDLLRADGLAASGWIPRVMLLAVGPWGSVAVDARLWFPPIVEELRVTPGNLPGLWRFFVLEQHPRQSVSAAFMVWADMTTAVARRHVDIGWGAAYTTTGSWPTEALAVVQLGGLACSVWWAWKAGHRFLALLCLLVTSSLLVSPWSLTPLHREPLFHYP